MRSEKRRVQRAFIPAAFGVVCCAAAIAAAPAADRPNVLLVTIDTLRADHLGAYGYARIETPAIDRLAKRGTLFARAFTPVPLTFPAHAAIMTGTYPPSNGARNNGQRLPAGRRTLAEILKERGYRTGAFVGAFPVDSRFGLGRGFEIYDDHYGSRNASRDLTFVERKADDVNAAALVWLGQKSAAPFFAWIHYFDPHAPYEPPPPFAAGYRGREYDGEIAYADAALGRLLSGLEAYGALDDTLVILTADHGESLGEHGEATHGIFVYDATLRVPLILAHPALIPAGQTIGGPADLVDVAPTILDLLGLPVPPEMQGLALSPALRSSKKGAGPDLEGREIYLESQAGWLDRRWAPLAGIRSGSWKYIDAPQPELYDLRTDPGETKNVISAFPAETRRLKESLAGFSRGAAAPDAPGALDAEARKKLRSLGYLGGDAVPASARPPDPKSMISVDNLFNAAVLASEAGRLEAAASGFRDILEKNPRFAQAYEYAAYNLYKMERIEEAVALLRKAISAGLWTPSLASRLGLYLQESDRIEESIAVLEDAAAAAPDDTEVRNDFGVSLFRKGDVRRSIAEFEKAIALDPSQAMAFNNLGNARLALKEYDAAGAAYAKAAELDPRLASAFNGLGAVAYRRGDASAAIGSWERAVSIDPGLSDALYNLGRAYLRQDRKKDALRIFEEFVRTAQARKFAKDIAEVKGVIEKLRKEIGGSAWS